MELLLGFGWLVLILAGVPVYFAIGTAVILFMLLGAFDSPIFLVNAPARLVGSLNSNSLIAVVFFILAANLMNKIGATERLVRLANALVGFLPGGLGQVAVAAEIVLSGMSGSGLADAAGSGSVLIPAMKRQGYSGALAAGIIGASSVLGPLIPPSIPMIIYGLLAGASVGALFIGGIIPGLVAALGLMVLIAILATRLDLPRGSVPTASEAVSALVDAVPSLFLPVVIIGGIIGGIFTPTEAAVVASVYALILGALYRSVRPKDISEVFLDTAQTSAVILAILGIAGLLSWNLTLERIPQQLVELFLGFSSDPVVLMTVMVILLLILGCFLEMIAVMVLTVPIALPVMQATGIDLIHFGVVIAVVVQIGTLTPPFGLTLFLLAHLSKEPIGRVVQAMIPFYVVLVIVLLILMYFPLVSTFLPDALFGT